MAHYKIEARDSGRAKLAKMCGGGMATPVKRAGGGEVVMPKKPAPLERDPKMTIGKGTMCAIAGLPTAKRLDKFARGGGVKKKGDVNIIIAPPSPAAASPGPMPPPAMMGPPPGAPMPPPGMPPRPMAPSPGGTPPMGGPAPMMRKRGGRTVMPDAGAGSGIGRLEKAAMAK